MRSLLAKTLLAATGLLTALAAAGDDLNGAPRWPTDEFHFVRMYYNNYGGGYGSGFRYGRGSYATDYPDAEQHFTMGVSRLTRVDIGQQARMIAVTDDMLFDYPWLYAVEVGHWYLGDAWELANEPYYPEPMTALATRFAVNYVIYAMTH